MIWINLLIAVLAGAVLGIIDTAISRRRWKRFTNSEIASAYQRGVERGREIGRAEVQAEFQYYNEDK